MKKMTEYRVMINGIQVTARYSQRAIDGIFLPLLRRLTALERQKGRRILALLAAPPGCGKTTLSSFLEALSREQEEIIPLQAIGMDGFHRRQEYLKSHFAERDGRQVSMVEIKGAPVTFDLRRIEDAVKRIAEDDSSMSIAPTQGARSTPRMLISCLPGPRASRVAASRPSTVKAFPFGRSICASVPSGTASSTERSRPSSRHAADTGPCGVGTTPEERETPAHGRGRKRNFA